MLGSGGQRLINFACVILLPEDIRMKRADFGFIAGKFLILA